jgi:hypothetical protein
MRSVSYQGKVGEYFFLELLVLLKIGTVEPAQAYLPLLPSSEAIRNHLQTNISSIYNKQKTGFRIS